MKASTLFWNMLKAHTAGIATSNPNALRVFAAQAGICVNKVVVKEGKVERAPASGDSEQRCSVRGIARR